MKKKFVEPYIRYGMCHEDPLTLLRALPARRKDVLSIGSGGDNALALLGAGAETVTVFDRNRAQIYLCKLKAEAARRLEYDDVLVLAGAKKGNISKILAFLKPFLDKEAYEYFEAGLADLERYGMLAMGKFEYFIHFFTEKILPLCFNGKTLRAFASIDDLDYQKHFYKKRIDNIRWKFFSRLFFSKLAVSHIGRDKSFFKYTSGRKLAGQIKSRLDYVFGHIPNADNPFVNFSTVGDFSVLPYWLKEENFYKIKANIGKLSFITGDIDTVFATGKNFDFFNLSDIFEYMSEEKTFAEQKKIEAMANPCAAVVFWNMLVDREFKGGAFAYDPVAESLYAEERTFYYKKLYVYRKST